MRLWTTPDANITLMNMMRRFATAAILSVVLFATTGCNLLLLDTAELGAACSFEGDTETECGRCISQNCGDSVNQCCSEVDCRPALDAIDQCSDERGCSTLSSASNTTAATISACVQNACLNVCAMDPPPAVARCDSETCPTGYGCDSGYCHKRCIDDVDCGAYRDCSSNFCSEPIGTRCSSSSECNATYCLTLDNHASQVAGYCSLSCYSSEPCPSGFECLDHKCYKVSSEGAVCPQPDWDSCGSCVHQQCGSYLTSCCEERPECNWVVDIIKQCDADRTYDTCNELYNDGSVISDFADYALIDCITMSCEDDCWNPCPGEGCHATW